jgi:hypothetical protein
VQNFNVQHNIGKEGGRTSTKKKASKNTLPLPLGSARSAQCAGAYGGLQLCANICAATPFSDRNSGTASCQT